MKPAITIADWAQQRQAASALRRQVFVVEQGVPEALELDEMDAVSLHALAYDDDGPLATGRLLPDGHIGRMAVLPAWRRSGVGTALLRELLSMAAGRGDACVVLHAQAYVTQFYRRAGFEVVSPEFMEAGIPHVRMQLRLR